MFGTFWENIAAVGKTPDSDQELACRFMDWLDRLGSLVLNGDTFAQVGASRRRAYRAAYDLVLRERAHMRTDSDGRVVVMSNREFDRLLRQRAAVARGTEVLRRKAESGRTTHLPGEAPSEWGVEQVALSSMDLDAQSPDIAAAEPVVAVSVETVSFESAPEIIAPAMAETAGTENPAPAMEDAGVPALPELPELPVASVTLAEYDWFDLEVASPSEEGERDSDPDSLSLDTKLPGGRQSLPDRKREPWVAFEGVLPEWEKE